MTDEQFEELKALLTNHYPDEHKAFVETLIRKEQRKQELWEKVKQNVGSWGIIAVLSFIALSSWEHIVAFLKR